MDVTSIQSCAFYQYLQRSESLSRNGSSSTVVGSNVTDINVGYLYPHVDPGAVFERTFEGGIVEFEGEQYYHSGVTRVENAISWTTFQFTRYSGGAQIGTDIDYTAHVYNTYKEYINSTFTGEERDAHMAKLHELTAQAIENIANEGADDIGGFLERYGFAGEKDILKQSIFALFEESLSSKSDVRLADFGIAFSENKSENLYSMDEILAFKFTQLTAVGAQHNNFTREEFPAQLINCAMKKESIYEAFLISDPVKDKLETLFSKRINEFLDAVNKNNAEILSKMPLDKLPFELAETEKARLAPYDKEAIWKIINSVVESMRSGLSAMEALENTDYLNAFFKGNVHSKQYAADYGEPEQTLFVSLKRFLGYMGSISQLSTKQIDWTTSVHWMV